MGQAATASPLTHELIQIIAVQLHSRGYSVTRQSSQVPWLRVSDRRSRLTAGVYFMPHCIDVVLCGRVINALAAHGATVSYGDGDLLATIQYHVAQLFLNDFVPSSHYPARARARHAKRQRKLQRRQP
jgi:hypothetical protein